jgi:hypothetical protein
MPVWTGRIRKFPPGRSGFPILPTWFTGAIPGDYEAGGYHWDEMKIGPGAPPFKTDKGWLHIYHGVFKTMSGTVYRLGAALHDLDDPATDHRRFRSVDIAA